tara:strand:- start:43 stop:1320 length:1278 start_codon:yes stop_codon:yes gene_type:complete
MVYYTKQNEVKMIKIIKKTFAGIERNIAKVSDLQVHPTNVELYPEEYQTNKPGLQKELILHNKENGYPNYEPIFICRETGTAWSGNSRVDECKKAGIEEVYVEYAEHIYNPDLPKSEQIKILESYNSRERRNVKDPVISVHSFKLKRKIFIEENGRDMTTKEIKKYWNELGVDTSDYNKWLLIFEHDIELLKKVSKGEMKLTSAYNQAKASKPDTKEDPNRFNFFEWYDSNPNFKDDALKQIIKSMMNFDPIIHDRNLGFETGQITGMVSNTIMSYFAKTFNDYNLHAITPKNTDGHPDIRFPNKDKEGYQSERIEIKGSAYNRKSSATCMTGGPGVKKCHPHEYIFFSWNADLQKLWAVISTITRDDWKSEGGKYSISISDWFKKYRQTNKWRQIAGHTYMGNKDEVEVEFLDVQRFLDKHTNA